MTPSDPPLLKDLSDVEYRNQFYQLYCCDPIVTFDGIEVRFRRRDYDHAFMKSTDRRTGIKDCFAVERQQRILWIKHVLQSPTCELRFGWDSRKRIVLYDRRVALYRNKYVVVIRLQRGSIQGQFHTAFVADDAFKTVNTILQSERWKP